MTSTTSTEIGRVFGESSRQTRKLRSELARIESLAAAGDYDAAAESLLEVANDFHYAGFPRLVLAVIADLRELVPPDQLSPEADAWAVNYEALGLSALGDEQRSGELLETMLERGRALQNAQIISTALQNLGGRALAAGDTKEAIRLAAEAFRMKRELGDEFASAQVLLNLASALQAHEQPEEAEHVLTEFAPLITRVRDAGLRSSLHGILGQLQARRGDFDLAEGNLRKALRFARRAGDLSKEVIALQNLGSLEVDRSRPGHGLRWYRRGLARAEAADAPPQLELLYRSIARALHRSGRKREAAESLEQAQAAAERFGDPRLSAGALADLGALRVSLGEPEQGRALLARAVELFAELRAPTEAAQTLRNLAVAELALDAREQALAHLERALELTEAADPETRADLLRFAAETALASDDRHEQGVAYLERELAEVEQLDERERAWRALTAAALLKDAGAAAVSLRFYDRAADRAREVEDDQLLFDVRNDRATALVDLERYDEAVAELEQLVAYGAARANRAMEHQALYNLGETVRRRGEPEAAVRFGRQALELARALDDINAQAETLSNLALALADLDALEDATSAYADAEQLAQRAGNSVVAAKATSGRASLAFSAGRYDEAEDLFREAVERAADDDAERGHALAGVLEAMSAAGRDKRLDGVAQDIVDLAQRSGLEDEASVAFAQSARWWLSRGELDEAASLYAIAIVLAAVSTNVYQRAERGVPIDERIASALLMPVMLLVLHGQQELAEEQDAFYEHVFATLDEQYEGVGVHLRFLLDIARQSLGRGRDDAETE